MYGSLFIYFLAIFLFAHFGYMANLRKKYGMEYIVFLESVGIGGGIGLFLGMVGYSKTSEIHRMHIIFSNSM
jgi:hypothetical protein